MSQKTNTITVGESEKHEVVFRFDHWWGGFYVYLDGKETEINGKSIMTGSYSIQVGTAEKHTVTFQILIAKLFPAFQKKHVQVLVDGKLEGTYEL